MDLWINVLNVLLLGIALGALLWGARQRALLTRVHEGLLALREGRNDVRLRQGAGDHEAILSAFDAVASQVRPANGAPPDDGPGSTDLAAVLPRLCDAIRPPIVAIQTYATMIASPEHLEPQLRAEYVARLQAQADGLLRLLESPSSLSDLKHDVSGLQQALSAKDSALASALLVTEERKVESVLSDALRDAELQPFYAPGADAASVMVLALRPMVVLIDGAWAQGLGWSALLQLSSREGRTSPCWIYCIDESTRRAVLWTPDEIWFWPTATSTLAQHFSSPEGMFSVTVTGESELSVQVVEALQTMASAEMVSDDSTQAPPPNGSLLNVQHPDGNARQILVLDRTAVANNVAQTAQQCAEHCRESALSLDEFRQLLQQRLNRLKRPQSESGLDDGV